MTEFFATIEFKQFQIIFAIYFLSGKIRNFELRVKKGIFHRFLCLAGIALDD